MNGTTPMALSTLLERLGAAVSRCPDTHMAWVTAELSDVSIRGGHCYMELVEKDPSSGANVARIRANIWANAYGYVNGKFRQATGSNIATGMKVLVQVSARFHPVYGLSMNISDIDPAYTLGDRERLRREILQRLQNEGILKQNQMLQFGVPTQRVAVVSARNAAGFGDFCKHLCVNPYRLRFEINLFPAFMQGDRAVPSILNALEQIANWPGEPWDAVVILRGGGGTSDLDCFDSYDLGAAIATFPIPVISAIGHERDVTIPDFVAAKRFWTPTAAAAFLVDLGAAQLARLQTLGETARAAVADRLAGCRTQLAFCEAQLPLLPAGVISRQQSRLDRIASSVAASRSRIAAEYARLDGYVRALSTAASQIVNTIQPQRLNSLEQLARTLSPKATLRRGYSITRVNGHAVTSASQIPAGTTIQTLLADGVLTSISK